MKILSQLLELTSVIPCQLIYASLYHLHHLRRILNLFCLELHFERLLAMQ